MDNALKFSYDSREKALAAAKKAIKRHPDYRFRSTMPDGTDGFEVTDGKNVIECHIVASKRKGVDYSGNSEE